MYKYNTFVRSNSVQSAVAFLCQEMNGNKYNKHMQTRQACSVLEYVEDQPESNSVEHKEGH